MPREAYFLMLMALDLGGGVAIWLLGRPIERVVQRYDIMASLE
jgi:hypothetical protein